MKTFRIGELAKRAEVTVRTIRYYESLGLMHARQRKDGEQREYTEKDLVYLERIKQLKRYGLTLDEIADIIRLGREDSTGEKRRIELLKQYREKLSKAILRKKDIESLIAELAWHIEQLEKVMNFQACPGEACRTCDYYNRCEFKHLTTL